jgi:UDP-N-acetyl-D-galactosamine dehydrogenase
VPILEENSGLKLNEGFLVGYSPERISPGMTGAELSSVRKLISGSNERAILALEDIYAKIIDAGVVTVPSIRVAELSKVFENTQRDVNIALVNELSKVCSALNIDTSGVLDAASTKWNFTRFDPGLVGGHCISVDPYYLIHKAVSHGYVPRLMSEARTVNESMPLFVVSIITRALGLAGVPFKSARVGVMGVTYKADVPDLRNSKVFDLIRGLKELFNVVLVCDSVIQSSVSLPKDVVLVDEKELNHLDILVVAVPHKSYATMDIRKLRKKCRAEHAIFVDIAGLYDRPVLEAAGFEVIRL